MSTPFTGELGPLTAEPQADRAPGVLDLVRSFVNTVELPSGPDELDSLEHASEWCLSRGLAPVTNQGHLHQLRDFLERLRDLLFANNGEGDAAAAWESLRPFLASTRLSLAVVPEVGLELVPQDKGPIASLLAIVYDAVQSGAWARMRACRKETCKFAYFDQTKNGSRAWCSMATCGNRAKAQRRRERAKSANASTPP